VVINNLEYAMNKDYYSGVFTWTQPYQMTWHPAPQLFEVEEDVVDLTQAQELIARIKNDIRD
jgi:hypothetical protein